MRDWFRLASLSFLLQHRCILRFSNLYCSSSYRHFACLRCSLIFSVSSVIQGCCFSFSCLQLSMTFWRAWITSDLTFSHLKYGLSSCVYIIFISTPTFFISRSVRKVRVFFFSFFVQMQPESCY